MYCTSAVVVVILFASIGLDGNIVVLNIVYIPDSYGSTVPYVPHQYGDIK